MGKKNKNGVFIDYKAKWLELFNKAVAVLSNDFKVYCNQDPALLQGIYNSFEDFIEGYRSRINAVEIKIRNGTEPKAIADAINAEKALLKEAEVIKNCEEFDANFWELVNLLKKEGEFTKEELNKINALNVKMHLGGFQLLAQFSERLMYTQALLELNPSKKAEATQLSATYNNIVEKVKYITKVLATFGWYQSEVVLYYMFSQNNITEVTKAFLSRVITLSKDYKELKELPLNHSNDGKCNGREVEFNNLAFKFKKLAEEKRAERIKLNSTKVETDVGPEPDASADFINSAEPPKKEEAHNRLWKFLGVGALSVIGIGVAVYMTSNIQALKPVTSPLMNFGNICKNFFEALICKAFGRS